MDRKIVYPTVSPLDTDILDTNKFAMLGLGSIYMAAIGPGINVYGLGCTPTTPASLSVLLGSGGIIIPTTADTTAYGSDGLDTTTTMKCGLTQGQTIAFTPPTTTGQSRIDLIEVAFTEFDDTPVVLPYYNAANPSQGFSGANGSGAAINTNRRQQVTVQVKQGTPSTSPTAPAPDNGFTGLWLVRTVSGATTIPTGNITAYGNAPFINYPLAALQGLPAAVAALQSSLGGTQGALGYVPANRAGDTFTGAVAVNSNLSVSGSITRAGNVVWDGGNLTNLSQLANGPAYLKTITSALVVAALGYTPFSTAGGVVSGNATVTGTFNAGNVEIGGATVSTQTDAQNRANVAQTNAINTSYTNSVNLANNAQANAIASANNYSYTNSVQSAGQNIVIDWDGANLQSYVNGTPVGALFRSTQYQLTGSYIELPTGALIQYGTGSCPTGSNIYVGAFPVAFPTACFMVVGSFQSSVPPASGNFGIAVANRTQFTYSNTAPAGGSDGFTYIAIGY
jgi:hypothetical protein